jgi:hypothetical protein
MGINTLTPRYLNLDNDSRIVAAQEMIDALNVRVSADDGGDQGVVKNIAGNSVVGNNLGFGVGNNKVVGVYEHEGTNRVFAFVHNSNGTHTVYEMGQGESSFTKIIESGGIELSGDPLHIDGVVVDGNLYLYFTDGVNEPQKVNVDTTTAIGSYPALGEGTVAKVSPLAPSIDFSTDSSRAVNDIIGKSFQFALQYVFSDGEVSAIGEYSENLCAPNTLFESVNSDSDDNSFNKITITHNGILGYSASVIPTVNVYFRDVTDNTMYDAGEYAYNDITTGIDFYNDGVYPTVSDAEYNKLQDSVPRTAQAQTITANRLFYGNYTEGFDQATVSATLAVNYSDEALGTALSMNDDTGTNTIVDLDTTSASALIGTGNDVDVILDYTLGSNSSGRYVVSTAPTTVQVIDDATNTLHDTTNSTNAKFEVKRDTNISAGVSVSTPSNATDFNTKLAAEIDGLQFTIGITPQNDANISYFSDWAFKFEGFAVIELTATATATGVEIQNNVVSYNLTASQVLERTGSGSTPADYTVATGYSAAINASSTTTSVSGFAMSTSNTIAYSGVLESKTFKSSESHAIGVVFEDDYGRTTGVYELGSVEVEEIGARAAGSRGIATIDATLSVSGLDSALTKYFYVHSGGSSIEKYLQFGVTEAVTVLSNEVKEQFSEDAIFVSLRSIEGKGQSFNSRGGDLDTGFAKGDKLRILSHGDTTKTYPQGFVFNVAGVYNSDSASDLNADTDFQGTGSFLVLENANYEGFGVSYVGTSDSLWEDDVLVEVFTPKKENETRVYRAISQKYYTQAPISNIGQVQNLNEGNAWYKRRLLQFKGGADRLVNAYAFVESQQYSDLDSASKGDLGGKPYAVIDNEKEHTRISSITYSEPQLADSAQNNLSSFNNSLANFADYEMNYGGIYGLVDSSDSITILQSDKVSRIPVSRNILTTASGQDFVTQTNSVLGVQQSYGGNFGINEDRQAFLKAGDTIYLIDVTRSKIVALSPNGVKILSDMNISSWVEERCDAMLEASSYSVSVGNDKKNSEIIFTLQDADNTYNKSIVYSSGLDKFTSFVNYSSDFYGNLGNRFLQVRGDDVYEAETNSIYGQFFGLQYDAYVKAVFNQNPVARKVFNAVGVDGTANPSATISTIDQSVSIPEGAFSLREGVYYANVPKEEGTSQFVMLGAVRSENDPEITFEAKVNRLPFKLGGDVYKLDGGVMTQIAGVTADSLISSRVVSMTNGGSVSAGDVIGIKGESVDGDSVRGAYAEVQVDFNDATAFELFAISAHTSESGLHNNPQTQQ